MMSRTDHVGRQERRLPSPKTWQAAYDGGGPMPHSDPGGSYRGARPLEYTRKQGRCNTEHHSPSAETTVLMRPAAPFGGGARLPDIEEYRR